MHVIFELDSEEMVEEQALAFVRNLVYGSVDSVQQVFTEDGAILASVERQLCIASRPEVCTQVLHLSGDVLDLIHDDFKYMIFSGKFIDLIHFLF